MSRRTALVLAAVASLAFGCKNEPPAPSTTVAPAPSAAPPIDPKPTLAMIDLSPAGPEWSGLGMLAPAGATLAPQSPGRLRIVSPGTGTALQDLDVVVAQHPDEAATVKDEQKMIANVYAARMKFHRQMTFAWTKETADELAWSRSMSDAPDDKPEGFRVRKQVGDKSVWCGPVQDGKAARLAILREMCASLAKK